jgi:dienelactone hydrolase
MGTSLRVGTVKSFVDKPAEIELNYPSNQSFSALRSVLIKSSSLKGLRKNATAPATSALSRTSPREDTMAQTTQRRLATSPIVSVASAPAGTETLAAQWVKVAVPDMGIMLAAVARPSGAGPFPTILLLHGGHGFAKDYVRLAQELADGGLLAMAACWFQGGGGAGARFITPISCPEAPPVPNAWSPEAMQTVASLVQVARTLPGARPDRIGLFGHSRGGGAALNYILQVGNVQAAVLNSSMYPTQLLDLSSQAKIPILMLHGTADSAADGGGPATNVQVAREFEAALRAAGTPVEAVYYEGGRHNDIFSSSTQHGDEVQRMLAFFVRHLRT